MNVGVGFADRHAAAVVAVGFLRIYGDNTYRVWTEIVYQNKHYDIDKKIEGTLDDRRRDRWTNFILRIKEQETRLNLQEYENDDDGIPPIHEVIKL